METKKEILKLYLKSGFLLDKTISDSLLCLSESFSRDLLFFFEKMKLKKGFVNKTTVFDNLKELKEFFLNNKNDLDAFLKLLNINTINIGCFKEQNNYVKILSLNIICPKKIEVGDFIKHFKNRYEQLKTILQKKKFSNLKSLRRIYDGNEKQDIIVSVLSKRITKNKNLLLEVEDNTGMANLLINTYNKDLFEKCKNIFLDDVLAFNVSCSKKMLYVNDVIFPDCELKEKRTCDGDDSVVFISDIHVGSKMFLEENFLRFISWINGESGDDEQKKIAKKVKYLFICGDNIDGVGVYPGQEKLLNINNIVDQYNKLAELLNLIRKDINIIMCPGQHDAVWIGEPQPKIGENWASKLYKMSNLTLVTNPCLVEIMGGFKILMYHGASFHGLLEELSEIRLGFGHTSPTSVAKEVLKRRHLAPIHGSCDYVPLNDNDALVIESVPDILTTGDWHKLDISNYNNILLIASSCWQSITPFEEKVGNVPDPCKVSLFNLKTREIKILDFNTDKINAGEFLDV